MKSIFAKRQHIITPQQIVQETREKLAEAGVQYQEHKSQFPRGKTEYGYIDEISAKIVIHSDNVKKMNE